ncbi:MAG TPA: carboxypeptidase-like regulatory domain-containing protein [Candidatus Acidoferrales bacterium]|nr:carboxypeptidase-like regulatory domain-containing protein [Candidatus Acidoferrales bacterium]
MPPSNLTYRVTVLALSLAVHNSAQSGGTVEGVVVNSVTRAGLAGVTVELTAQGEDDAAYRTTTDSGGTFRVTNVAGARYLASYELAGFTSPDDDPADRPFHVIASPGPVRLRQELVPLAVLSGRVLDSDAMPVDKVAVECVEVHSGWARMVVTTNMDGRFKFSGVTPGAYLLRAAPGSNFYAAYVARVKSREEWEKQTGVNPNRKLWPPTYYPHTIDRLLASAITVRGGEDMQDYEIFLQQTASFRVRGVVLDERGRAAGGARVMLKSADSVDWAVNAPPYAQTTARDDGRFEFPTVGPGRWRLIADWSLIGQVKNPAGDLMGFASAVVTGHDLEEVPVRLTAPFTLTATMEGLHFAPQPGPQSAPQSAQAEEQRPRQIRLIPVDGPVEQEVYSVPRKEDRVQAQIYPGRYRFSVGSPTGYYLDAILMGERNVMAEEVEMSASSPPVRLIYRSDGGHLHGTVENGAWANVVLFPQNPALLFENLHLHSSQCDSEGRFEIAGIRPGDYYAVAVDRVDWSAFANPAFAAGIARTAVRVRVDPGVAATLDLRPQPWPE